MLKIAFRNSVPVRSLTYQKKAKYIDYFNQLRSDFNSRCGYCNSFDLRRYNDFEIDHFVPKRVFSNLKLNDYHNLIYSCKSCNRSKKGTWPSNNESITSDGEIGFVDPCMAEYDTHFARRHNGEIVWESNKGKWMFHELSLFNPKHTVLWQLEKLMNAIVEGRKLAEENPENHKISQGLIALFLIQEKYLNKLFDVD